MNKAPRRVVQRSDSTSAVTPESAPSRTAEVFSYAILTIGVLTALFTAYLMVRAYSPAWFADQWIIPHDILQNGGSYSWKLLWTHHNEHRAPIPKLFHLADLYAFQGRNIFLFIVIFLTQLCTALAWMYLVHRTAPDSSIILRRTCAGLVLFCLFSPLQYENFFWAWQLTFVLPFCFAVWSVATLARYSQIDAPGFLGLSVVAFTAAVLSLASGMLLFPALLVMAVGLRLRWRAWVVILVAGCVNLALYLPGMHRPGGSPGLFSAVSQPLPLIDYVLTYFGSTWGFASLRFGKLAAALAILSLAIAGVALLRSRRNTFAVSLIAVGTLALGTATVTALGRVHLGIGQALSSRYQTVALLLWLAAGLAIIVAAHRNRRLFVGLQFLVIAVMSAAAMHIPAAIDQAKKWDRDTRRGELALMARVEDQPVTAKLGFDGHFIYFFSGVLQEMEASVFSTDEYQLLGTKLENGFRITSATECAGVLESATMIVNDTAGGYKLSGWGYDAKTGEHFSTVVLASSNGRIVGLGASIDARPDILKRPATTADQYVGFTGYVQRAAAGTEVRAYGVMNDGHSICPLDGQKRIHPDLGRVPDAWKQNATVLWTPSDGVAEFEGVRIDSHAPVLTAVATASAPTFVFDLKEDLTSFRTLAIKVWLPSTDYLDVLPGSDGSRRMYTMTEDRWVYIVVDLAAGGSVSGTRLRFTPANSAIEGAKYQIAEILANRAPISSLDPPIGLYLE